MRKTASVPLKDSLLWRLPTSQEGTRLRNTFKQFTHQMTTINFHTQCPINQPYNYKLVLHHKTCVYFSWAGRIRSIKRGATEDGSPSPALWWAWTSSWMTSPPWFPAKRAPTLGSKTLTGASGGTPGEEDQTTSMAVTAETAETSEGEEG